MGIEKGRVGQFFIFIGAVALIIFFTAGATEDPPAMFFLAGALMLVVGVVLIRKDWKPSPQSGRFRMLNSLKRKKEEKKNKDKK